MIEAAKAAGALQDYGPLAFALVVVVGAIVTWRKTEAPLRQADTEAKKVDLDGHSELRADMRGMIAELRAELKLAEQRNEDQRKECDHRMERMEQRHAAQIGDLISEVRVLRHADANKRQALYAFAVMLEKVPDKRVSEAVASVKEMLAQLEQLLATEKAGLLKNGTPCSTPCAYASA